MEWHVVFLLLLKQKDYHCNQELLSKESSLSLYVYLQISCLHRRQFVSMELYPDVLRTLDISLSFLCSDIQRINLIITFDGERRVHP